MDSFVKNIIKISTVMTSLVLIYLTGCAAYSDISREQDIKQLEKLQEPTANLVRTGDTPLVAAIPGLNIPFAPVFNRM